MRRRKRTTCGQCGNRGQFTLLELLWRFGGAGPWTWCSGYLCAGCRAGFGDWTTQLGLPAIAWDG